VAIQIIKFEGIERWAAMHTTSDTMYAPVFFEELLAELFVAYQHIYSAGIQDETHQINLVLKLQIFLDETCAFGEYDRRLPALWALALVPEDEDPEDRTALAANYNGLSLLEDLQSSHATTRDRAASFMLAKFNEWVVSR
jgi:hypothetical protein